MPDNATSLTAQRQIGTGEMDILVNPPQANAFRLVYLRIHFADYAPSSGGEASGAVLADLQIWLKSAAGDEHNVHLFTYRARGVASDPEGAPADVNLILGAEETARPSGWTFQPGDKLRLKWSDDEDQYVKWGIETGYVVS